MGSMLLVQRVPLGLLCVVLAACAGTRPASAPVMPTPRPALLSIDDVDTVPGLSMLGRAGYREWLQRPNPRAFVVAEGGYWTGTWGTAPKDMGEPLDPRERALKRCRNAGKHRCTLYAVDHTVVYSQAARLATP
jgi:hypothetical protein